MYLKKIKICENTAIIDQDYKVGDKVITKKKSVNKYETPVKAMYEIVQTWTNSTVTLQTGAVITRMNIRNIKP